MEEILQAKHVTQYLLILAGIIIIFAAALVPLFLSERSEGGSEE